MTIVREATGNDVDIIYDLILSIARHQNQEQFIKTDKNEILKSGFSDTPRFRVLLAEVECQIIGYILFTWNYSIWFGSYYMNIDDVFVREECRGQMGAKRSSTKPGKYAKIKGYQNFVGKSKKIIIEQ